MSARRFTRRSRLLKPAEFQRVFRQAKRSRDSHFTVLAAPQQSDTGSLPSGRLGLAISKRVEKRAVGRNRLKRLIRESFRHHPALVAGQDWVVMATTSASHATSEVLTASLASHWRRLSRNIGVRDAGRS